MNIYDAVHRVWELFQVYFICLLEIVLGTGKKNKVEKEACVVLKLNLVYNEWSC